jgi:branched-chain amino acid transport system substrate-binding protein
MYVRNLLLAVVAGGVLAAGPAAADINVGVTLSATGPAASLGIPEKNTIELLPTTIAGEKINWIVLDDASDTTRAVTNTKKLITEDKADVIVGSTITPNSLAMIDVVAEAEVPMISMAASSRIVDPTNPKTRWVFKTPQNDALMADAIAVNMKANGIKTMAYIGFADAYGDGWLAEMRRSAQTAGIKIVAEEKYNRNDASVTGQVLKIVSANPDAVLIGAAGTPGATPQKELVARGYKARSTRRTASPTRLPARRRQGRQRHAAADRADAGVRAAARFQSDQEGGRRIHRQVRNKYGKDSRTTFGGHAGMRICCWRRPSRCAEEGQARHEGVSRGAARFAGERQGAGGDARRVHDVAAGAQRARQSRADDDPHRQRQVGIGEVTSCP